MRTLPTLILASLVAAIPLLADEPDAAKDETVVHVDAGKAATLLETDDKDKRPVVLDIRTADEFTDGHLKDAKNVDFRAEDFADQIAKLDKEQPYLVYCGSGGRSSRSLETFRKLGFKKIFHLDGGILGWEDAELPVVKD